MWAMAGACPAPTMQRDLTSGKTTLLLGGQAYFELYNCSIWFVKESPLIKLPINRAASILRRVGEAI